jgi:ankyrin repeat protein
LQGGFIEDYVVKRANSLLYIAVKYEKIDIVELFIKFGADINFQSDVFKIFFYWIFSFNSYFFISLLFPPPPPKTGVTSLILAARLGNLDILKMLVENKANVNLKDNVWIILLH